MSIPFCLAEDWYFRPMHEGPYGQNDGSSYENAWHKSQNIKWELMNAGDILYVLGKHFGSYGDRGWGDCTATGITISGRHINHPLEQGVITNAFRNLKGEDWNPSNRISGAYEHKLDKLYQALEYDSEKGYKFLQRVSDLSQLSSGSFFRDSVTGNGYWMPTDINVDSKRFLLLSAESSSLISGKNVTIQNLHFVGSPVVDYKHAIHINSKADSTIIQDNYFQFCRSAIGAGANAFPSPDNVIIRRNTAENGKIFLYLDSNYDPFVGWIVTDNLILNMDQKGLISNKDNEVFYIQSAQNSVFSSNVIDGFVGGAIDFYAVSSKDGAVQILGNLVEKNIISNGKYIGYGSQITGLLVSADNHEWDINNIDPYTNNIFRYNIIYNLDANNEELNYKAAIRIKSRKPKYDGRYSWYIYNNLVYDVKNGMFAVEINEGINGNSDLFLVNNIFSNIDHAFMHRSIANPANWIVDHNQWSGIKVTKSFELASANDLNSSRDYQQWVRVLHKNGAKGKNRGKVEKNSITDMPLFRNAKIGNFHLSENSSCIDAGMDILIGPQPITDFDATLIPVNGKTDIGPLEYFKGQ